MPGQGAESRAGQGTGYQPRKDYQPQVTTQDLGVMVGKSLDTLIEAIKTEQTERLTSYLAFSSRFHRYSRRNQQLIFQQCPEATRVASYPKWKEEGYQVRWMDKKKGEKGISILVPKFPKSYKKPERRQLRTKEDGHPEQKPEDEYKVKEVDFITHSFRVGTVFDVTHLIPEDQARVPRFFTAIEGDHEAVYERLIKAARLARIEVRESLDTEGAQGYSAMGLIVVRPDQPPGNKAAVIAHEWGHEILHDREKRLSLPGQVKECHAEATAFVVLSHFGITIPYSADYLINWGNNAETLRKELDLVTAAASQIIMKVHSLNPGEEHFHDEPEPEAE
jgi:N-terminal domain of anti-restriction factor ArdC